MSVIAASWKEIPKEGRGGGRRFTPERVVKEDSRVFRCRCDSNLDRSPVVMDYASCPKIGAAHPDDAELRCIGVTPDQNEGRTWWQITCDYSNEYDIYENPLNDPAKTSWSTETFQTPVWRDIHGNAIVNSAGDPFDPPADKDDSRWTSVTRKNVANIVPPWIFAYQDGVNSDSYQIDGKTIDVGEAKISAINLSEPQERNDIEYRVLTVTIHYRGEGDDSGSGSSASVSSAYGTGGGGDEFEPWDLVLQDVGFREIDDSGSGSGSGAGDGMRNITNDDDGQEVSGPVPLDGEGHKLANPTFDNIEYLDFEIYRKRAFDLIESLFS